MWQRVENRQDRSKVLFFVNTHALIPFAPPQLLGVDLDVVLCLDCCCCVADGLLTSGDLK